jgi:hypothetical protein
MHVVVKLGLTMRALENRVQRKILEPKRDQVRREWRRLRSEELYVLYSSSNYIWVIKSRRI